MIRKATVEDATQIQKLVNHHASKGLMLPRSLGDICDNIRDFFIYENDEKMIGCCALNITWLDLAEIRSLAVEEEYQGKGIGKELVNYAIEDAKRLGVKKVFALTNKPEFFTKLGFQQIDKSELPHKVWVECVKCVKFPDCDESAFIKSIDTEV